MAQRVSYRVRLWIMLTLAAVVLASIVPLAVGAVGQFPAPDDVTHEPVQKGSEVLISSGKTAGLDWRLSAYESDQGLCVDLNHTGAQNSRGGGCGFGLSGEQGIEGDNAFGVANYFVNSEDVTFIYGPTVKGVERVAVTLHNGQTINLPTKAAPSSLGNTFNFYVTTLKGNKAIKDVAAKNSQGATIDHVALPRPNEHMPKDPLKPSQAHPH